MPNPGLSKEEAREAVDAYAQAVRDGHKPGSSPGPVAIAAQRLGIENPGTMRSRIRVARETYGLVPDIDGTQRILASVGYEVQAKERTPEDAWAEGHDEFERTVGDRLSKDWRVIKRPAGPGVIWHGTDFHVDDPGCARRLLEADIRAAHDMGAVIAFGGDLLNNWPLAGRLAKKWAEQKCTLPDALLRAQYVLELASPHLAVWGNHEEMNPYLSHLLDGWLPKHCLSDYWTVNAVIQPSKGRPVRVILSHKFQKGQSWFHKMHGHIREMLEGNEADLLLDGHLHCDGVMEHSLPERGHAALAVASGGYKVSDSFARRISRGGGVKLRGRSHFVVYDPDAGPDESLCTAFKGARQAEAYLGGLMNLRAT